MDQMTAPSSTQHESQHSGVSHCMPSWVDWLWMGLLAVCGLGSLALAVVVAVAMAHA